MHLLLLDKQAQWNETQLWSFRPFQAANPEQMRNWTWFQAHSFFILSTFIQSEKSLVICESCLNFNPENWYLMLDILVSDVQLFYWIWPRDPFGLKSVEIIGPGNCTENVYTFFFSEFGGFQSTLFLILNSM